MLGKKKPEGGQPGSVNMSYTLEDLTKAIAECPAGQSICLPYDEYKRLFPPEGQDEGAPEKARKFAKENGCTINHHVKERAVFFVKPK